jgi:ligand-binding sensor domain-containing protein
LFNGLLAQQNHIHYTVKDGLPQMQCMKLFQDSKGYIWIATKGGVSRYDGVHFENFSINEGLPDNQILAIQEAENGTIWVLSSLGLSKYTNHKFEFFAPKKSLFFKKRAFRILKNQIWLIANYGENTLIRFKNGIYTEMSVFKTSIQDISVFKESIYFIQANNLYTLTANKKPQKTTINDVSYFNKKEGLLIRKRKIYTFNQKDTFALYNTTKNITRIKRKNDSTILFVEGKFKLNMPLKALVNGKLEEKYNYFDQINDILVDSEKNVWLASEKGLYKQTPFNNYTSKDGMPDYVWSIQEDNEHKVWFASYSDKGYLYYYDKGKIKKHSRKFANKPFYMGATKTTKGNILFPHLSGVLSYNGKQFKEIKLKEVTASVSVFEDDETKKIYLGSYKGLITISTLGNQKINKRFINGKDEIIQKIIKNKKGELWFVSRNSFGILNRKDTLVLKDKKIKGAVTLFCDYKDNLWIGTSNGLYFYDYTNFIKITHPELNTMINAIVATADKHFVYGGLRGIGILDLKQFYSELDSKKTVINAEVFVAYYSQSQGFLGEEIGQNGVFKDSKGTVWMATNNNVVSFEPKDLVQNQKAPYTYIRSFQNSKDNINWEIVATNDNVFNYNYKNIQFDFIGISHTAPKMVKYKHRLKGFSNAWSKASSNNHVSFTNLEPNTYTFELLAANNNGVWTKSPISKTFTIKYAWWQSIWFKIILALCLLFLIFKITNYRYKNKLKKAALAQRLNDLQIQAKQAQIYPHLLFNTVTATGSVIYKENKEKAYDFVVKLSKFMRLALDNSKKTYKTLAEEMDFVSAYLQIQKMRFPERFNCKITIDSNVNQTIEVPPMIVQTYVENAVKYGLEPLSSGGFLQISIRQDNQSLFINIEDNGIGIEAAKKLTSKGTGSGLKLMNEIYAIHNQNGKYQIAFELIDLYKKGAKGTCASIHIKL